MEPSIQHALVTGGAGFIGSHLVDRLVAQGTRVTVIDNLSTGRPENLDRSRAHIRFFHGDIRDGDLLGEAIAGCDVVFHLAAVVSVTETVDDPLTSASINDQGTLAVLETARTQGCARVVLSSSCAVYGDDPRMPKDEGMRPKPMSPYAVQKLAGELYAGVYSDLFGLETVCLRYFNVYGPRQDPSSPYSGVISIFMSRALKRQPVTIYGDGLQYRDFIYVQDVVDANLLAAVQPAVGGGVFNIGTGRRVRINDLWTAVASIAGWHRPPVYASPRSGDIRESVADVERSGRRLGFTPAVAFEKGLAETYAWYRQTRPQSG